MSRLLEISERPLASVPAARAKHRVNFLLLQFFALIYFQKLSIGPGSAQISIPLVIMFASMVWMLLRGDMVFVPLRLATYFLFIALCLLSQIMNGAAGSLLSMPFLIVLYAFMTVTVEISGDDYRYVLDRFVKFMIVPAIIILVQYVFQRATGLADPIDMTRIVPANFLLRGYLYAAHYPWNSTFSRPNGFFFLEPSYASAFAAIAAIIELTYFKRVFVTGLMLLATVLSLGGTGMTLLVISAPFLLARHKPAVVFLVIATVAAALLTAYFMGLPLPLVSRLDELHSANTSGAARLLRPAAEFISLILDPAFLFSGSGAGSTAEHAGYGAAALEVSPWPVVKLMQEYGFLATTSFLLFYVCGIVRSPSAALAVSLSFIYHVTGGYLLSPIMVMMLVMFCFIVAPVTPVGERLRIGPGGPSVQLTRALSRDRAVRPGLRLRPP